MVVTSAVNSRFSAVFNRLEETAAFIALLLFHVHATFLLLPPSEVLREEPLYHVDYPLHTYRVYMYREALKKSGLPWGYDPAAAAGLVLNPSMDVSSSKPQQILGVLLPFLAPGTIVRLFLFVVVMTFPLWTLLACRRLRLPFGAQIWIMLTLLIPAWFYENFVGFFYWGVTGFIAAAYFSPYVLALFVDFLDQPSRRAYFWFCAAATLLFLLHALGPLAIAPSLILYTLVARRFPWKWRIAALFAPLVILTGNAFWFVPLVLAQVASRPTGEPFILSRTMVYSNSSQLLEALATPQAIVLLFGLGLAFYGFLMLRKSTGYRVVVSFGIAAMFALFLKFFGSFVPFFDELEPKRFMVPAFALLSFPVGFALFSLVQKARLPVGGSAIGIVLLVGAISGFLGKPERIPLPPYPDPVADFISHYTSSEDRLLIQSYDGYWGASEAQTYPLTLGREVISDTYPVVDDPAQFLRDSLWGKKLDDWAPQELRSALERWGIAWVFARTEKARTLMRQAIGGSDKEVGKYRVFQVPGTVTRFLVGSGQITATVNRIVLSHLKPESGLVVLKYRYHPAWEASSAVEIQQYPIPEDALGFISLRNAPESLVLKFNPSKMLQTKWR